MRKRTALQRAIFESRLTQKAIAADIGISESHLSRIVNGTRHGDDATWAAIARVLCRDVDALRPESEQVAA